MSIVTKRPVHLRVHPDDVERIDQLARQHRLNRTDYMVRASLNELGSVGLDERVEELQQRIEALERRADLAYG